ncbi:heterokaryon incompatibility protein-domain-containing protein [Hypoxylon sp. NC1633]|nr:heterokaryon incompatibility protein-domain-containing protein [Hypoxylon sp. NC1633]
MSNESGSELHDLLQVSQLVNNHPTIALSRSSLYDSIPIPKGSKTIRLLDVERLHHHYHEPLVGSLRVVSLQDGQYPSFTALSYVWGEYSSPRDVLRSGETELEITRNCRDALRRLRQRHGAITIWIDAICINQDSPDEKKHQIPLMMEIYTRAETVYIWLGMESQGSDEAMDYLQSASTMHDFPFWPKRDNYKRPTLTRRIVYALSYLPPCFFLRVFANACKQNWLHATDGFRHIAPLLGREWFTRAWTFQEGILARDSVVLCGSKVIRWDALARGLEHVHALQATFDSAKGSFESRPNTYPSTLAVACEAFRQTLWWWMTLDRSTRYLNDRQTRNSSSLGQTFRDYQSPYIHIYDDFTPIYKSVAFPVILLVISLVISLTLTVHTILSSLAWGSVCLIWTFYFLRVTRFLNEASIPSRGILQKVDDTSEASWLVESIVQALIKRKASQPRDKSYSLYGILKSIQLQLPEVDHNKSRGRVFFELFSVLLQWQPSFVILLLEAGASSNSTTQEIGDVPSWVPDFHMLPGRTSMSEEYFSAGSRQLNATSMLEPHVTIAGNGTTLLVRGHLKTHITYCTSQFQEIHREALMLEDDATLDALDEPIHEFASWIYIVRREIQPTHPRESIAKAIFTTLDRAPPSEDNHVPDEFDELYRMVGRMDMVPHSHDAREAASRIARNLCQRESVLETFVDIIRNLACQGRRLFVTADGSLGSGCKDVIVGDRLALVGGVPAPLALRSSSDDDADLYAASYRVICSTFVHGWMDGSAQQQSDMKDISLV